MDCLGMWKDRWGLCIAAAALMGEGICAGEYPGVTEAAIIDGEKWPMFPLAPLMADAVGAGGGKGFMLYWAGLW